MLSIGILICYVIRIRGYRIPYYKVHLQLEREYGKPPDSDETFRALLWFLGDASEDDTTVRKRILVFMNIFLKSYASNNIDMVEGEDAAFDGGNASEAGSMLGHKCTTSPPV